MGTDQNRSKKILVKNTDVSWFKFVEIIGIHMIFPDQNTSLKKYKKNNHNKASCGIKRSQTQNNNGDISALFQDAISKKLFLLYLKFTRCQFFLVSLARVHFLTGEIRNS